MGTKARGEWASGRRGRGEEGRANEGERRGVTCRRRRGCVVRDHDRGASCCRREAGASAVEEAEERALPGDWAAGSAGSRVLDGAAGCRDSESRTAAASAGRRRVASGPASDSASDFLGRARASVRWFEDRRRAGRARSGCGERLAAFAGLTVSRGPAAGSGSRWCAVTCGASAASLSGARRATASASIARGARSGAFEA
jgi:hypothetical protein